MSSDLYKRVTAWNEAQGDADRLALHHRVWDRTPWMVNWYTGGIDMGRTRDMIEWCYQKWGDQAWWPADRAGAWQRGSVTIHGWEWWGFDTETTMREFIEAWPLPEGIEPQEG